jgi:hypothetical protein
MTREGEEKKKEGRKEGEKREEKREGGIGRDRVIEIGKDIRVGLS